MVDIKSTTLISFDEFYTIVDNVANSCFIDGVYSPNYYELILRVSLLRVFAPNYNIPTVSEDNYNDIWEMVTNDEAEVIINTIKNNRIYPHIEKAIKDKIDYQIKVITSGSMSMSDIALSKLFEALTEKAEKIDTSVLTEKNMNIITKAFSSVNNNDFAKNFVEVLLDEGIISKPNRETRRKNIKQTKKVENSEK